MRVACTLTLAMLLVRPAFAQSAQPIAYTLRVSAIETHMLDVGARIPTDGHDSVVLTLPIWSPGFYRVQDYAGKIQTISALGSGGTSLTLRQWPAQENRWTITTRGVAFVTLRYRLLADGHSVTTNWVGPDLGVVNGPATFVTLVDTVRRPYEVTLVPPVEWPRATTALAPVTAGRPAARAAPG